LLLLLIVLLVVVMLVMLMLVVGYGHGGWVFLLFAAFASYRRYARHLSFELTCLSHPLAFASLLSPMPSALNGLLKLAVLETASTWPGLPPLGSTSMPLASLSALDSNELGRGFRLSFFRASCRAIGDLSNFSTLMAVIGADGVGVCGCVVCGVWLPLLLAACGKLLLLLPSYDVGVCMPTATPSPACA